MGRTAKIAQGGRASERNARIAKARQRRRVLDKDRAARDARIDQALADVYLAQDERDDAATMIQAAEAKMGAAIVRILAAGVLMAQVAELTELSVTAVQRLKAGKLGVATGRPAETLRPGARSAPITSADPAA